jgi:hypothetical protein
LIAGQGRAPVFGQEWARKATGDGMQSGVIVPFAFDRERAHSRSSAFRDDEDLHERI